MKKPTKRGTFSLRSGGVPTFAKSTLAIAVSGALMAQVAIAQDSKEVELDKLKVEEAITPDTNPYATPGSPYLAERLSDPRRTRELAKTPQTITVLTATQIEESGRSDLRDILDGQPGITLGTGENGNAFGDRYVIRGHEARSDMFVDGLRDPGMTIRESFAIEQVEISKGPSSTFAGRGTTGGAVNSVSKRASTEYDFANTSVGIGLDNYHRLTADVNQVINYDTAVRANVLHAQEDVPDRDPADRERKGAALSVFHQLTDSLELNADYYHFQGEDNPDLGTYLEDADGDGLRNDPVKDIPAYVQDDDFLESTVNTLTLRTGYEFNDSSRIVNLFRYGTTENGYVVSGTRGGDAYPTALDATNETNAYAGSTLSTHNGWQEVDYVANQLNYLTDLELGGMEHELVIGAEYSQSTVLNGTYDIDVTGGNCWGRGRDGTVNPATCIYDVNGNVVDNLNSATQRSISKGDWDSDWNLDILSLSVMDTVDLTDDWTVFGGLRYDYYDYELKTQGRSEGTYSYTDGAWNGHVGASYNITNNANVYTSVSTATNLNGGESDVGTSGGYGGFVGDSDADGGLMTEPERTTSYEIGTKWKLNNGKLLATAAAFLIDKDDVNEGNGYDPTGGSNNTGGNRVEGVEFGLAGNITDDLSIQAGLTLMNAKITETGQCTDRSGNLGPCNEVGNTLANFADNSFSVHAKYQATPQIAFGGGMTYESERFTGQPDAAANESMSVPEYTVFDAFASYKINRDATVRLNVNNVFDEDYYLAAYRSGSFTYIGDGRSASLTLDYKF
jgi:catecholate siderophore receptor